MTENNFEQLLPTNTKSPTLELLLKSYYKEDPEELSGAQIVFRPDVDAEEIRFASDQVVATIWRPSLDVKNSQNWASPWNEKRKLRMRIFLHGNIQPFRFNGLETGSIEIDMQDDGELRPVFYDPRGTQIGEPIDEKLVLNLVDHDVEFSN